MPGNYIKLIAKENMGITSRWVAEMLEVAPPKFI